MCHMLTTLIFYNGLWNLIGFIFLIRELTHRKMKKSPKDHSSRFQWLHSVFWRWILSMGIMLWNAGLAGVLIAWWVSAVRWWWKSSLKSFVILFVHLHHRFLWPNFVYWTPKLPSQCVFSWFHEFPFYLNRYGFPLHIPLEYDYQL